VSSFRHHEPDRSSCRPDCPDCLPRGTSKHSALSREGPPGGPQGECGEASGGGARFISVGRCGSVAGPGRASRMVRTRLPLVHTPAAPSQRPGRRQLTFSCNGSSAAANARGSAGAYRPLRTA
jgi:hypothetical protein